MVTLQPMYILFQHFTRKHSTSCYDMYDYLSMFKYKKKFPNQLQLTDLNSLIMLI